jgi:hypothetical protein
MVAHRIGKETAVSEVEIERKSALAGGRCDRSRQAHCVILKSEPHAACDRSDYKCSP